MIEAKGLTIRVGEAVVLFDAAFRVEPGELALLAGDSGSGKSTLLAVLGGLAREMPEIEVEGEARVADLDVLSASPKEIARRIGQVFQATEEQLLALDVEGEVSLKPENLAMPAAEGLPLVTQSLARFGLLGLERRASSDLSGGEAKRVALAQALATRPATLLLDEPLTGLSARWRDALLKDVASLKGDVTQLLAEHRAAFVAPLADRAFYIGEQKLIGIEPALLNPPLAPPPARPPLPQGEASLLDLVDVVVRRDAREVVKRASFSASRGFVALTGENGAGKTTLLKAILGLLPIASGSIALAGLDPHAARPSEIARKATYVPQRAADAFTCDTVREEIALGAVLTGHASADEAAAHELIRWGLSLLEDRHPLSLSAGERQRVAFAAALAPDPKVLILDEPTLGLDKPTLSLLLEAIELVAAHGLVVVATHDDRIVERADAVLLLKDGEIGLAEGDS